MLLKCKQCNDLEDESPSLFYKRTRKIYDTPFFCRFCVRVKKLNDNPKLAEKKFKDHNEKITKKRNLKIFIKKVNESEYIKLKIQENIELLKEKNFEYRKSESGRSAIRSGQARRRAKLLGAIIDLDSEEHAKVRKFYGDRPEGYHVDHIIPISKGGKHCLGNLQYLTAKENLKKNNKIDKFLIESLCDGQKVSCISLMRKFKITLETARELIEGIWY